MILSELEIQRNRLRRLWVRSMLGVAFIWGFILWLLWDACGARENGLFLDLVEIGINYWSVQQGLKATRFYDRQIKKGDR